MAVFKRMFKKFLGFEEEDYEEDNFENEQLNNNRSYYEEKVPEDTKKSVSNVKSLYSQGENLFNTEKTAEEIVLQPKSFGDACDVVDKLMMGYIVVLNLEDINISDCKRIADFVLGAAYVLQGDVEKISKKSFRIWTNK